MHVSVGAKRVLRRFTDPPFLLSTPVTTTPPLPGACERRFQEGNTVTNRSSFPPYLLAAIQLSSPVHVSIGAKRVLRLGFPFIIFLGVPSRLCNVVAQRCESGFWGAASSIHVLLRAIGVSMKFPYLCMHTAHQSGLLTYGTALNNAKMLLLTSVQVMGSYLCCLAGVS